MNNHVIDLENLLGALRDVQSLTPKIFTGDPKTQIGLPQSIITRTKEDALSMGVSTEVLIIALLQAFHDTDGSFKIQLARELDSVVKRY